MAVDAACTLACLLAVAMGLTTFQSVACVRREQDNIQWNYNVPDQHSGARRKFYFVRLNSTSSFLYAGDGFANAWILDGDKNNDVS